MSLTLEKIEATICNMDQTYDANFGEWIRNEENCRIIAYHLKRYILEYPAHDFVVVLKWTVKDWTLRSIIILTKMMIIIDIEIHFEQKMDILQGLIFTWHPAFIAEFLISTSKILNDEKIKKSFMIKLLQEFDKHVIEAIIGEIGDKIDQKYIECITNESRAKKQRKKQVKRKKLLDAFNIL